MQVSEVNMIVGLVVAPISLVTLCYLIRYMYKQGQFRLYLPILCALIIILVSYSITASTMYALRNMQAMSSWGCRKLEQFGNQSVLFMFADHMY